MSRVVVRSFSSLVFLVVLLIAVSKLTSGIPDDFRMGHSWFYGAAVAEVLIALAGLTYSRVLGGWLLFSATLFACSLIQFHVIDVGPTCGCLGRDIAISLTQRKALLLFGSAMGVAVIRCERWQEAQDLE